MLGVLGAKLSVRYLNNPGGDLAWLKEIGVVKRRGGSGGWGNGLQALHPSWGISKSLGVNDASLQ